MTTTEKPIGDYQVIGKRPIRPDGWEKVTGQAIYGADVRLPGMIYGVVLRSPYAHARIKKIDTSKATALPGVLACITGSDMPLNLGRVTDPTKDSTDAEFASDRLMAFEKVTHKGHPVAAIAAVDLNTANEAINLIEIEYEPLKPVLTVDEALAPDAPIIHPGLVGDDLGETVRSTNMAKHLRHEFGDVDAGFSASSLVVEREFELATVHQGYIEPQNATAIWQTDGQITIWTSTQGAFSVRGSTAGVLKVPESKIKVVPCEIGGGFGGKLSIYLEPVAALLSRKTGRPVQVLMDRKNVFEATGPTPGAKVKVKLGVDDSGKILAGTAELRYEAGAYPGSAVGAGAMCIFAPYRIENLRIDGYDIVVNKPKSQAYRAPGATQAGYAMESVVDEVCEALKMDPLEFRLLNATREGDRRPDGPLFPSIGNTEVQQAAKESPHWTSELKKVGPDGKLRGRGVATGFWFNGGFRSSVNIGINADGTVSLVEGSVDIGGTRASISMQAAEVLCVPVEDVRPVVADTDSVGYNDMTGGSRTTNASGHAAYNAAKEAIEKMSERAAKVWDISANEVEFNNGLFTAKSDPELKLTFKEVAAKFRDTGGPVNATGAVMVAGGAGSFATCIIDVEVDADTGKVDVIRATMVQDAGKAIHPAYVEGQMQGGTVQGIGWALNEEYYMNEEGSMVNSTLLDYRIPTSLDLPLVETIIVEVPNPSHPFGVRGVGESSIIPPVPAVANAIYDAIGSRMRQTPMKPSRIREAIERQTGS